MSKKAAVKWISLFVILLVSLACNLITGGDSDATPAVIVEPSALPTEALLSSPTAPPPTTVVPPTLPQLVEIRQWATSAQASSQYGNPDWSARQATGSPNTSGCGDRPSAWASASSDGEAWLRLGYETPVKPTELLIHQTYSPSSVVRVTLVDPAGDGHVVYTATPQRVACPYVLSISIQEADYLAQGVLIEIDQSMLNNWNEIDAVELVGLIQEASALEATAPAPPPPPTVAQPTISQPTLAPPTLPPAAVIPFDPNRWFWDIFDEAGGLPENMIKSMAVDPYGVLWVATGNEGIASFDGGRWTLYSEDEGPKAGYARAIRVAPDGALWFGTYGAVRYDGQNMIRYRYADGLVSNDVTEIAFAPDGAIWFAAIGGVSRFDGVNWTNYTVEDGIPSKYIESIAISPDGTVWIGTWEGAARLDGDAWVVYKKDDGLGHDKVNSVVVAPDGAVWFGTGGQGAARFDGSSWSTFRSDDGLAAYVVTEILLAPDGALWFGTAGQGAYRYDRGTWLNFTAEDGLAGMYVDALAVSREGILYFGTRKSGVARLAPQ